LWALASAGATAPFTIPTIIITAGITWATTITAQKPRKDQTRRPLLSEYVGAANAGAADTIVATAAVANALIVVFMAVSFLVVFVFVLDTTLCVDCASFRKESVYSCNLLYQCGYLF
jgi:hypothetical protein